MCNQICVSWVSNDNIKQRPPSIKTTRQPTHVKIKINDEKIWMYPHKT
jgi:hypothetical protein